MEGEGVGVIVSSRSCKLAKARSKRRRLVARLSVALVLLFTRSVVNPQLRCMTMAMETKPGLGFCTFGMFIIG